MIMPVGQVAALQVGADRIDGGLDIGQPLAFPVAHTRRHWRGRCVTGRQRLLTRGVFVTKPRPTRSSSGVPSLCVDPTSGTRRTRMALIWRCASISRSSRCRRQRRVPGQTAARIADAGEGRRESGEGWCADCPNPGSSRLGQPSVATRAERRLRLGKNRSRTP
jgi:hypothetical protein